MGASGSHIRGRQQEDFYLLCAAVVLLLVGAPTARGPETGGGVRLVRQTHHLLSHPVIGAPPHRSLRLTVRNHVDLMQVIGRSTVAGRSRLVSLGVGLTRVCPLLDDRRHPRFRHLRGQTTGESDFHVPALLR